MLGRKNGPTIVRVKILLIVNYLDANSLIKIEYQPQQLTVPTPPVGSENAYAINDIAVTVCSKRHFATQQLQFRTTFPVYWAKAPKQLIYIDFPPKTTGKYEGAILLDFVQQIGPAPVPRRTTPLPHPRRWCGSGASCRHGRRARPLIHTSPCRESCAHSQTAGRSNVADRRHGGGREAGESRKGAMGDASPTSGTHSARDRSGDRIDALLKHTGGGGRQRSRETRTCYAWLAYCPMIADRCCPPRRGSDGRCTAVCARAVQAPGVHLLAL